MKNALLAVLITTVCNDHALAQITPTGAYSPPATVNSKVSTTNKATGAIITGPLTDGTISTDRLANELLTTNKLTDGVETSNKLADDIINSLKTIEDARPAGKQSAGIQWEALPLSGVITGEAVECGMQQLHKPRPISTRKRTGRLQI
ncbi:hypothetical protein A3860_04040 [Niastella vici]|uniref:Uncharacterized protein n=1 Tax=Niastella vici TaxID=1703345 RepID=A0A1V9FRF6_9BACT|nr:hypothetical protein [Niastella vici]OQP60908.1 hypothetical protein A3860_04040 [Niastella vici]